MNDDVPPLPPTRPMRIEFTGSGSEYFRIWIVNLLLCLVTLGLYLPFAKARRLRYFYGNTIVDGHALAFHGDPWRMFRGFVLLLLFAGTYTFAGHVSRVGGLIAFCLLAAMWPALWRSSLRFRLGNTSWRGLRFAFRGGLADAYKALLPLYLPALVVVAAPVWLTEPDATPEHPGVALLSLTGFAMLAMVLIYPWAFALIKRYQHGGYACADQRTRLAVPTRRFYFLCLKGFMMYVGAMVGLMILSGLVVAIGIGASGLKGNDPKVTMAWGYGIAVIVYVLMLALVGPWFVARLQNMIWSGTASDELRFDSRLGARALVKLTVANWLLTAITLGLYRPFAAVKTARLRLEAVQMALGGDVERWVADAATREQDASGDAAGDFFGIDLGL